MSEYETRVIEVMVNKKGEQVFSDHATRVRIVDESAGEFVEIDQGSYEHARPGVLRICADEWPLIREAVDQMLSQCREAT